VNVVRIAWLALVVSVAAGESIELPELTVSAPAPIVEGARVTRYGDKVETVTAEQVDALATPDLATALNRVPGVTMSRHNPVGAFGGGDGGAVFIRGHGSSRPGQEIGTLVDGVPRLSGIWNHSLLDMLPVDSAETIDVYKSPQPVLYGNMSFGVIDMHSKRRKEPGSGGEAMVGVGAYGTTVARFEYGAATTADDYFVQAVHRDSEGHRDDAGGDVDSLYGRYGWRPGEDSDWYLSFQLHHTASTVDDPLAEGAAPLPLTPRFITRGDLVQVTAEHEGGRSKGFVKFYLDDGLQNWEQYDTEPFASVTNYRNYGMRARRTTAFGRDGAGEFVLGLDHDFYGGSFAEERPAGPTGAADIAFRNTAPYTMVSWAHRRGDTVVTPSAGLRWNDSRDFDDEMGNQWGLTWERRGTKFFVNGAHSFNLPGVFTAVVFGGGPGGTQWRSLQPETVDHREVGFVRTFDERTRLSLSRFDDDVEHALRVTFPGPRYENVGDYQSDGYEFALHVTPNRKVSFFFGGTFADTTPSTVPYQADRTLVAGCSWRPVRRWSYDLAVRHSSEFYAGNLRTPAPETRVDGHAVVNLRVARSFEDKATGRTGEFFVTIENLGSCDYELKPGYPMAGAWAMAGVKVRF